MPIGPSKYRTLKFSLGIVHAIALFFLVSQSFSQEYVPSDHISHPLEVYDYEKGLKDSEVRIQSHYLTMRDGVQIAVDVFVPKHLAEDQKLPTILFQTRYWRSIGYRWPVSMFLNELDFNGAGKSYIKNFINNGYAFVSIDVRGSGASTGIWNHPFHKNEVLDGLEIVNWIINQPWSNGKIGLFGRSYSGSAAEFALINNHPSIKASVPMYTPFDVFDDIGFPGGVHNRWYTTTWGKTNTMLDNNRVPVDDWKARLFVSGVNPVKGKKKVLKKAIKGHEANVKVDRAAHTINFRDDKINDSLQSIDVFSPYTYLDKINRSNVPIYSYSGWMDAGYQHAAIKRYLNLTSPYKKLIIGPWDHMGRHNASPFNPGKSGFDHFSELLKFFDFHVKGIDTGIYEEYPIHFFTMGEEKWKGTNVWPPNYVSNRVFYLIDNHVLSRKSATNSKQYLIEIDTAFGVGHSTRWEATAGDAPIPPLYNQSFENKEGGSIIFSTPTLHRDIEVTGHPIVQLMVNPEGEDLSIVVYLEEVDEQGKINHITEGHFRAIHRSISMDTLYKDLVPQHSFLRSDQKPLVPKEWIKLTFDLLPTSYLFRKGHQIQFRIASGDKNHFKNYNEVLRPFRLLTGNNASSIILPIAER